MHRHLTHLISPCEWIFGCHSLPFSYGPPTGYLHPPAAIISSAIRLADNFVAGWSCGKLISCVKLFVDCEIIGQTLQQAFLSGLDASFSLQLKGGHGTRGQRTSKLTGC